MGASDAGNMIENMTDAQFRELLPKRAEAAMMAGKKVHFD